jgi:hypothetical protein
MQFFVPDVLRKDTNTFANLDYFDRLIFVAQVYMALQERGFHEYDTRERWQNWAVTQIGRLVIVIGKTH